MVIMCKISLLTNYHTFFFSSVAWKCWRQAFVFCYFLKLGPIKKNFQSSATHTSPKCSNLLVEDFTSYVFKKWLAFETVFQSLPLSSKELPNPQFERSVFTLQLTLTSKIAFHFSLTISAFISSNALEYD